MGKRKGKGFASERRKGARRGELGRGVKKMRKWGKGCQVRGLGRGAKRVREERKGGCQREEKGCQEKNREM